MLICDFFLFFSIKIGVMYFVCQRILAKDIKSCRSHLLTCCHVVSLVPLIQKLCFFVVAILVLLVLFIPPIIKMVPPEGEKRKTGQKIDFDSSDRPYSFNESNTQILLKNTICKKVCNVCQKWTSKNFLFWFDKFFF